MDEIEFYIKYVLQPLIRERNNLKMKNTKLLKEYNLKIHKCYEKLEVMISKKNAFYKSIASYNIFLEQKVRKN